MTKEANFFDVFNDILIEKGKCINDLELNNIVSKFVFYNYKKYCPSIKIAMKIANFVETSLDYILEFSDVDKFKEYKIEENKFYENLCLILDSMNVSKYKLCKDLELSNANFSKWKSGRLPKLTTVISISKYLGCQIDDLLVNRIK